MRRREEAGLAEVIQGVFPGAEEDGASAGFSTVATLNLSPEPGDTQGNLLLAAKTMVAAKRRDPSLRWVVLPELFTCGYSALRSVHLHAEDAERGTSARFFAGLARRFGIYIAYGFPETVRGSSGGVFDSAILVGPEGILVTYRKRNLVETTPEHQVFTAGDALPVVEAGGLLVSLAVCWDLGFPEVAREAAASGAQLILAPAAWRAPWGPQYELSCAARALDSGVYLASANQIGGYPEALFDTPGNVYGPDGLRVCRAAGTVHTGNLDAGAPARWRSLYGSTIEVDAAPARSLCS